MSASSQSVSHRQQRNTPVSSDGNSTRQGKMVAESEDFTSPSKMLPRYFEPCSATASMLLYAQGNSVVVAHHDSLMIERRFSRHAAEVKLLAVDTQSDLGAGRLVVSYDVDMIAIVWDLMTGDEVARFSSYENLTAAAWMKNGNVAFGDTFGNITLFEPTTSEHITVRTVEQLAITTLAPAADCRTFALGFNTGHLIVATLQPRFIVLHTLTTNRPSAPIMNIAWHASSSRQKSDMLAVQTHNGDLRVWSVPKTYQPNDPAKVVRILKRTERYQNGPNWMAWSKNGRIIQFSEGETLSWDVRTKHVTYDSIPTLEHVKGLAVYGPGASLFTLGPNNTVQQFDLNTPSQMVANVQHPAALLPPSPPVSIEEQTEGANIVIAVDSDSASAPINSEVSESDEEHLSPLERIARGTGSSAADSLEQERYLSASPLSQSSTASRSSDNSGTRGRNPASVLSRGMTDKTYISAGSSLKSSVLPPFGDRDAYSISSVSSASSSRAGRHRPSRLRNEVPRSPDDNKVDDLFKFTRSRLHDIPYKHRPLADQNRLTNDDLRRQMLSIIFGWNKEIRDLVRDEMLRHPNGSASRILLAKWLGDIDSDIMSASSENMTSSDWMLLALSGIGGQASQHKLGRAYVQRLLEGGDVHAAATIMVGMGDTNDAIEIYISHRKFMEALILLCLFFPAVWERQRQVIKRWGEFAVQHGQQQLAIRCFACTGVESTEPWTSPSAYQVTFQNLNTGSPEALSPPLSPPSINRGPQRSIAKSSSLKVITSFGDQSAKSKFFAPGDDGQTPIAAGVTPIADSAIDDPATAFLNPSSRSACNTPLSARGATPGGFGGRSRLPSIGEVRGESVTPAKGTHAEANKPSHARKLSSEEPYQVGMSVQRAATASPMMMRDNHRRRDVPLPSPSPESFAALMYSGRSSRNGARERVPDGLDLHLHRAQDQSATPSSRFHWPKRHGPGSMSSSATSNSSLTGRSYRGHNGEGRSLNEYIHSLDSAKRTRSRDRSRNRSGNRHARSRDNSQTRKGDQASEASSDRGRSSARNTPKPGKHSPTSPLPMSPDDLINLSTPKAGDLRLNDESVIPMHLDQVEPLTVRKTSQIRASSRNPSRRRREGDSPGRLPVLALEIRDRSRGRGGAIRAASPCSPVPTSAIGHFSGSDDEKDLVAALEDQEMFRNRHNRSRGLKEPISPAVGRKQRDRSESRNENNKTPATAEQEPEAAQPRYLPQTPSSVPLHAGDLKQILNERQLKKEAAARELEERRKSLARRPSAPTIPHPGDISPMVTRPPSAFELPRHTYTPPQESPPRSRTADFARTSARNGSKPIIGLPATPKAMRLQFEMDSRSKGQQPAVPPIPAAYTYKKSPEASPASASASASPTKPAEASPQKQPSPSGDTGPSLLTLLPSTVYSPPTRPPMRTMSAPPEEPRVPMALEARAKYSTPDPFVGPHHHHHGHSQQQRAPMSRKMSAPDAASALTINGRAHARRVSRDDMLPPPPPPPMLKELQHLAIPPPPPPAPLPGSSAKQPPTVYASGQGTIEIVMDEDDNNNNDGGRGHHVHVPRAAPLREAVVPIIAPPAPPQGRGPGHGRGRSIGEKISRATERMRSAGGRAVAGGSSSSNNNNGNGNNYALAGRTKSPETVSPYETLPQASYTSPSSAAAAAAGGSAHVLSHQNIERHPLEVRAAYQQQQQQQQNQQKQQQNQAGRVGGVGGESFF